VPGDSSRNHMKIVLLLSIVLLGSCKGGYRSTRLLSANHRIYTAPELLPLAAGQRWTMQNQYGDRTFFQILARRNYQGCESGVFLDMYITKNAARAYWQVGIPGRMEPFYFEAGGWILAQRHEYRRGRPESLDTATRNVSANVHTREARSIFLTAPEPAN
jgi:hypothetical protein